VAYAPKAMPTSGRKGGSQIVSRLRGVCELDVSSGGMLARIASFHYDRLNTLKPVSLEEWQQYFTALGVVHGIDEAEVQRFYAAVAAEQVVDGMVIARGTDPRPASA